MTWSEWEGHGVKMKEKMMAVLLTMAILFMGCEAKNAETDVYAPVESEAEEHTDVQGISIQKTENVSSAEKEDTGEQMDTASAELSGDAVVIFAHIKEVDHNNVLISSDSDGFPGAFYVEVPENAYTVSELSGGNSILILMQRKEEEVSGTPEYIAGKLTVLEEQTYHAGAYVDLMLMEPPAIILADPLSSTFALFEVSSGNYSWNFETEDGEMCGVIACGMHPLDAADHLKLKLPQYQNMDAVTYMIRTAVAPDRLVVRKWDAADMGKADAEELSTVTFYEPILLLELEAGKVYEFTAVWEEKEADTRGFFGEASYTFVTE